MSTLTPPELPHCVGHVTFTRDQTGRANATPPTNEPGNGRWAHRV